MDTYLFAEKTNIIFHISTEYNIWNLEVFDGFKLIKKNGPIFEDVAKTILVQNHIIKGDELEVIKAKLCLMAP